MYVLEPRAQTVCENQYLSLANGGGATLEAPLFKTIAGSGRARKIPRAIIKSYWWSNNLREIVRETVSWMQQGLRFGFQQL